MRRILFTMLALLSVMAINAAKWTAPSESDFLTSTPIYVQVNVNGQRSTNIEVAAFINGECRASADFFDRTTNLYTLRVWGNPNEVGSPITFKAYDSTNDFVFSFTKTAEFTGETNSEVPFVLNIDEPTGVTVTDPIQILTILPANIDLSEYITLTYDGYDAFRNPVDYEPLGQSTLETELTYVWTPLNEQSFNAFTIDNKNILTATKSTLLEGADVNAGEPAILIINNNSNLQAFTTIIIDESHIPVTGISCSIQKVNINKGESLFRDVELLTAISVTPEDATNKNYYFECTEDADAFNNGVAQKGGTYNVKIVSEDNPEIYTTITVEVYAPVTSLYLSTQVIEAAIGDNILDLITPYVVIGPDDATDKSFSLSIPAESSDAIVDNVATAPGKYTVTVVSNDNREHSDRILVVITEIIAPETINVELNTNAYDVLRSKVQIIPEDETYTITPADEESEPAFVNEIAVKSGTFKLKVTATKNPRVSEVVVVNVYTPVDITFPTSLTISKYSDTEFELTVTGDDFDPSLVSFQFIKNTEPAAFGIPTITTADNGAGYVWNIRATGAGEVYLSVLYDGQAMPRTEAQSCYIQIPAEITFNSNGWDWIYAPDNIELTVSSEDPTYKESLNIDDNNKVIEIRSQTDLLYNDKTYGFIGTIYSLMPSDGMYKIKATYEDATKCIFTSLEPAWERDQSKVLMPGYTWIGYTNEWNMTLDELNSMDSNNNPSEGDQIIGKTNFAEYSGGQWVGADFTLEAGKGYIYYNSSDSRKNFQFDYTPDFSNQTNSIRLLSEQKKSLDNSSSIWEFDATQFADNMAIVAEISKLENPEDYTIGAFVGDECRGMGKVVKDGKMMINVAGKPGETVSFCLHNEYTGEFIPVETVVQYSQKIGSLKSPMALTAPEISGVSEITTDENDEETYYDLYGRKVDGNPSAGIYIVKTVKNGQVIVKKVSKK